jgi:tRNA (guanosine-2'-O-)-methyltransferase
MQCQVEKSSLRKKADHAKKIRCTTLTCVLENPKNIANVASVIRNIDCLGCSKILVVDPTNSLQVNAELLNKCSASAHKYVYLKTFSSTLECIEYLNKGNCTSLVTSPHIKGCVNLPLESSNFTKYKKLAVWFGNESKGVTQEAINNSSGCVQIEMAGIVESLNLAVSTGIVLHWIGNQRRMFTKTNNQ